MTNGLSSGSPLDRAGATPIQRQWLRDVDFRGELELDFPLLRLRPVLFEALPELLLRDFEEPLRDVLLCDFEALRCDFAVLLLFLPLFFVLLLPDDLRFGTFAPSRRASDNPIAMACLRLFTFLPLRPLRSLPSFISCISS